MNLSFWESDSFIGKPDVIIVGSGIVGLNTAIHLKEQAPSQNITIIESGTLPSGASTRNAGFACFGSISELLNDQKINGEAKMLELVEKRWKGLLKLRKRIGDRHMEYQSQGGYEIFRPQDQASFKRCAEQIPYLNKLLCPIIGHKQTYVLANDKAPQLGLRQVNQMIHNQAEGQIHTGKMMKRLLELAKEKQINIWNGLRATQWEEKANQIILHCDNGWKLSAKHILLATNGFAKRLLPQLDVKPARNQVLITSPIPNLPLKGCFHYQEGYIYFRNIRNRVLIGGGRHWDQQTETTDTFNLTPTIYNGLKQLLSELILPNIPYTIEQAWSGILGVGSHKAPIIQSLSPRLSIAVRLGGMGVAIGSLVGEEAANHVLAQC